MVAKHLIMSKFIKWYSTLITISISIDPQIIIIIIIIIITNCN